MRKIYTNLDKLKQKLNSFGKSKKIVLCHGVFDLLHIGHIKHLKEAKRVGDILVVTLTQDKYVNKGPQRPVFNEVLRAEAIASLACVNFVAINTTQTAVNVIEKIKPNVYCKGPDYKNSQNDISGQIKKEIIAIKKIGGKIFYTGGLTFSSSKLINHYDILQSSPQKQSIKKIKKKYTFKQIKKFVDNFKKIKVLIVGETIIDQYVFCEALGKSGKEPVLVLRDLKTEEYLGGAAALSRHISTFCEKISLLSMVGEKGDYLKQIKRKLPKNVNFKYIRKENSPTILKRRFLDNASKNKVLGVYRINDDILSNRQDKIFYKKVAKTILDSDWVAKTILDSDFNSVLCICNYLLFCLINKKDGLLNGKYMEWNYSQYLVTEGTYKNGKTIREIIGDVLKRARKFILAKLWAVKYSKGAVRELLIKKLWGKLFAQKNLDINSQTEIKRLDRLALPPEDMLKACGAALVESPFDAERHNDYADVLRQIGAFGAARLHFEQALVLMPENTRASTGLSMINHPQVTEQQRSKYFVSWSDDPPPARKDAPCNDRNQSEVDDPVLAAY